MKNILHFITLLFSLFAFSQSVEIDTSFGVNGKVVTGFGQSANSADAVIIQPDGKIIVGGSSQTFDGNTHFAMTRYYADGALDDTFGVNGTTVPRVFEIPYYHVENRILSLVLLDSGKFLAVGIYGINPSGLGTVIARFNSDGTIDTTFGTGGKVSSASGNFVKESLKILPDGKFIIGLSVYVNFNGISNLNFGFERYTEDGVLDTAFGIDGKVLTSFGNGGSALASMALLPDGKFVAAGGYNPTNQNTSAMIVAKYNADGSLDTTFDTDGKVTNTFGTGTNCYGVYISANQDGKLTVAGTVFTSNQTITNFGLVQYNPNGSLDTTFGSDGKAISLIDDGFYAITSIIKEANGKYIVNFNDGNPFNYSVIRKYNADISVDTSFGINGEFNTLNSGYGIARNLVITSDSKIIMLRINGFGLLKYNINGTLDTTFDTDATVTAIFEYGNDELKKIIVLPNDKIIAVGTSIKRQPNDAYFSNIVLSKYNSNGSLDTSFGDSGKVYSVFGENVYVIINAFVQTDGKILVNASYSVFSSNDIFFELIRYNPDGSLDVTFGNNGKIATGQESLSLINPADGKLLFSGGNYLPSGDFEYFFKRYNADGSIDNAFGTSGSVSVGIGSYFLAFTLQQDNKIIVSGTHNSSGSSNEFFTNRYNIDGSLDSTFGTNGQVTTPMQGYAHSNFVQPDGKIIVVGSGGGGLASILYNANGTIDATYGTNGIAFSSLGIGNQINAVYLQPDNKILVALGQENDSNFKIKRVNSDGTLDSDFGGNNGITTSFYNGYNEAFSIGLQSDNKVIVAGTTYDGINNNFALTRINNNLLNVAAISENQTDLIIYPNPVKDLLNIKLSGEISISDYTIYNLLGQAISKNCNNAVEVNTENLSKGIYTIQINTSKGIINKKFIKE